MAKRFTDTDKWKKSFIKSLPSDCKLFWFFICDECDHSGIWHVEMGVVKERVGIKITKEKIRQYFKEKIVEFDHGNKMFIPDFIAFQYGKLNPLNRVHASIIGILNKYDLAPLVGPYIAPTDGAKDKDKAKDLDKDKDLEEIKNPELVRGENKNLTWNVSETVLANETEFNEICMSSYKNTTQVKHALTKYHLWLEKEAKYPVSRKQAFAGIKLWLMNEKKDSRSFSDVKEMQI